MIADGVIKIPFLKVTKTLVLFLCKTKMVKNNLKL